MTTPKSNIESINFKRVFTIFFVALIGFGIIYDIAMTANGNSIELSRLWERLTLSGLRVRMFTDLQSTFRFIGWIFAVGFNALLALWVYADGKKQNSPKIIWSVLTLVTGLVGLLIYMIKRVDREENFKCQL